jgi:hypothetical protein
MASSKKFIHRDSACCLNHEEVRSEQTCSSCGEAFCSACVVTLQGQVLCGPCKNFRVRGVDRPSRVSVLALVGLILGLAGLPVGIVIPFLGAFYFVTGRASSAVVGATLGVGLLLPLVGLVLSWRALRALAAKPHLAGRVLALAGLVAASVSALWCAALGVMLAFRR